MGLPNCKSQALPVPVTPHTGTAPPTSNLKSRGPAQSNVQCRHLGDFLLTTASLECDAVDGLDSPRTLYTLLSAPLYFAILLIALPVRSRRCTEACLCSGDIIPVYTCHVLRPIVSHRHKLYPVAAAGCELCQQCDLFMPSRINPRCKTTT
jgi:hypothetical protein